MSLCIIKYTYTQYVGVDIEKYTRGLFEYVKEEFGEFQPQMSVRIPVDTRSLIPVISVHSISNLQYRRQS